MRIDTVAGVTSSPMESPVTTPNDLSDKALAVFAFAAYHQLESGDAITSVVSEDGAGHRADPEALAELTEKELGAESGGRFVFNPAGQLMLSQIIDRIRGTI
ncbi:hypothetical protein SAMN05216456_0415 [Devosia crocina]|uniref:Uncharacterized protein n=1 Tax=Devosia crocina TaxID=429728 RepID=A0A1I7N083_9HYPH|nr:hypothetical protein SAMN05216456_0415 [Devosia crocina]